MADQQQQGDLFADHFTLLQSLQRHANYQQWLAIDNRTSQKISITVFPSGAGQYEQLSGISHHLKGLIHPNIARHFEIGIAGKDLYLVDQYKKVTGSLITDSGLTKGKPLFEQLLDTLAYTHTLGFLHGNLTAERIQIEQNGQLYLTQFGWPPGLFEDAQINSEQPGSLPSDIQALGQLIYAAATGQTWAADRGFVSDTPIGNDVKIALQAMLKQTTTSSTINLGEIKTLIFRPNESIETKGNPVAAQTYTPIGQEPDPDNRLMQSTEIPAEKNALSRTWAIIMAVILVTAGLFIFIVLPELVTPTATKTPARHQPVPALSSRQNIDPIATEPVLAPIEAAQLAIFQEDSTVTAESFLRILLDLEDRGLAQWGTQAFARINQSAAAADELFKLGQYEQALLAYKQLLAEVTDLQKNLPTILEEQIIRASTALKNGDAILAQAAWLLVTQIQPDESSHLKQLARAQQLPKILDLMNAGLETELQGDLNRAVAYLKRAQSLDPEWMPAREAFERLQKALSNQNFKASMSSGFDALSVGKFTEADIAFNQAATIKPWSTAPAGGLQQVIIARRQALIASRQETAQVAITDEDWAEAATIYQSIIDLDDTLLFAGEGLKRAQFRIDMSQRLNNFLASPASLQQNQALGEAKLLAIQLSKLAPPKQKLQEPLSQLTRLISVARIPIPLTIESNNRTDVSILRLGEAGKLGLVSQRTLSLIPGHYVIVGKRRGYRDIRKEIPLLYGADKPRVRISCEEAI